MENLILVTPAGLFFGRNESQIASQFQVFIPEGHDHIAPLNDLLTFDELNFQDCDPSETDCTKLFPTIGTLKPETVPAEWRGYNEECFWDCQWVQNPFHKKSVNMSEIMFPDPVTGLYTVDGAPFISNNTLLQLQIQNLTYTLRNRSSYTDNNRIIRVKSKPFELNYCNYYVVLLTSFCTRCNLVSHDLSLFFSLSFSLLAS